MNKKSCLISVIIYFLSLISSVNVFAEIPKIINFQSILVDNGSVAVEEGNYTMTFSLWSGVDENSIRLWAETKSVSINRGLYSVELGSSTAFPNTLTFAEPYYLGIQVNGGNYLKIDDSFIPLTTNAYAFRSKTAAGRAVRQVMSSETLTPSDDIILADGNITITLPSASDTRGKIFTIENIGSQTVAIETNGSQKIDNDSDTSLASKFDQVTLVSNGDQWFRLGFTKPGPESISSTELANSFIQASKFSQSDGSALTNGNSGLFLQSNGDGTFSWGDATITKDSVSYTELSSDAVRETEMSDNSIVASKLSSAGGNALDNGSSGMRLQSNGDGTFSWAEASIAENAIHYTELAAVSVRITEIIDNSIVASKLAGNGSALNNGIAGQYLVSNGDGTFSWSSSSVAENSINYTELSPGAVRTTELADESVNISKIISGAILSTKLAGISDNGITGASLISNGDGTFGWGGFTSSQGGQESLEFTFGSMGADPGQFQGPADISVDCNGRIAVYQLSNSRIQVFTSSGEYSYSIIEGVYGFPPPVYEMYMDCNGKIYLLQTIGGFIGPTIYSTQVFTATGAYDFSIATSGSIAIDYTGNIYITNSTISNKSIDIYSSSGEFLDSFTYPDFEDLADIDVDSNGNIYVLEGRYGKHSVYVFNASHALEYSIGTGEEGSGPGEFKNPGILAVDNDGNLFVADYGNSRFQVFTSSGALDYTIPIEENISGFTVDDNRFYISEFDNNRVCVYNKQLLKTSGGSEPIANFTINSGRLGIGTTSPSDALDVSGSMKINNTIQMNPISITPTNPSAGWIFYDSINNLIKCYDGSQWKCLGAY